MKSFHPDALRRAEQEIADNPVDQGERIVSGGLHPQWAKKLPVRKDSCSTCPFVVPIATRPEMEEASGMPLDEQIRERGFVCHTTYDDDRPEKSLQCPNAMRWLAAQKEGSNG